MTLTTFYIIVLSIAFVLGSIIGSFLNVCIARVPKKESIVSPPSNCPQCKSGIRFYDNIPILSYLILKGKCRNCGLKISARYPIVELLTAILSVALMYRLGPNPTYLAYLAFTSALIVITFIDLDLQIIPDSISLPGIIVGFLLSFVVYSVTWLDSLIGIAAGGGSLMLVAIVYEMLTGHEGMGGGDIKLLAMIGAFIGWEGVLFTIMASSFLGVIIGGGAMVISGKGRKFAIPFGPFLSAGAAMYLFWGELLIGWYLNFFVYGGTAPGF